MSATTEPRQMDDRQILENIGNVQGLRTVEMGADGNCLFLSIAPQISADEISALAGQSAVWEERLASAAPWESLNNSERAALLRKIAMFDEEDFFAELEALLQEGKPVPADVHWRAIEMYKDMLEEFLSKGCLADELPQVGFGYLAREKEVRRLSQETSPQDVYSFVLRYSKMYMQLTGTVGNWAGSSEMAALARALRRQFIAYGNDWVSQDTVKVRQISDDSWEVLPYFQAPAPERAEGVTEVKPVRIFQTRGGGHYQMLSPQ